MAETLDNFFPGIITVFKFSNRMPLSLAITFGYVKGLLPSLLYGNFQSMRSEYNSIKYNQSIIVDLLLWDSVLELYLSDFMVYEIGGTSRQIFIRVGCFFQLRFWASIRNRVYITHQDIFEVHVSWSRFWCHIKGCSLQIL